MRLPVTPLRRPEAGRRTRARPVACRTYSSTSLFLLQKPPVFQRRVSSVRRHALSGRWLRLRNGFAQFIVLSTVIGKPRVLELSGGPTLKLPIAKQQPILQHVARFAVEVEVRPRLLGSALAHAAY